MFKIFVPLLGLFIITMFATSTIYSNIVFEISKNTQSSIIFVNTSFSHYLSSYLSYFFYSFSSFSSTSYPSSFLSLAFATTTTGPPLPTTPETSFSNQQQNSPVNQDVIRVSTESSQQVEKESNFFDSFSELFSNLFDGEKKDENTNIVSSNNNNNSNINNSVNQVDGNLPTISEVIVEGPQNLTEQVDEKQFFCGNQTQGSSYYINEFETPIPCSHPVGLAVDKDNHIWVASGWTGNLLVFDPQSSTFIKTIPIPNWPLERQGKFGSMIWDMKFDNNEDLWFTDQKTNSIWKYFVNEDKFENYRLLTEGGYPLSIVFDSDNKVWFTQVFGNRLGVLDPSQAESNTTNGISELDMSAQLQFQTMGPISKGFEPKLENNESGINSQNESLWFSTVTFPVGGQLIKYDIGKESLTIHDVTHTNAVPISIAEDNNGNVWTNDHAASIFLMLDPDTGLTKQYVTSNSSTASKSTLPYYNEYRDGKIWFNEHYGNAIAYFDIENNTLVEYIIPSINPLWGNSSNPLKFIIDKEGSVWFTEWTENKLGVIPKDKIDHLPLSLSISKEKMIIDSKNGIGDSVEVYIKKNSMNETNSNNNTEDIKTELSNKDNITMYVTSSISEIGELRNLTSNFSERMFMIEKLEHNNTSPVSGPFQPYKTILDIQPTIELEPGTHTLTISARYNNDITISKIIDLEIL